MPNYVYDETEVKLTGRKAKKAVPAQAQQRRRAATAASEKILYEVTPIDSTFEWKKWVAMDELFEVIEDETNDNAGTVN